MSLTLTAPLSLDNVSSEQLGKMKHCLGLNYKKRPYRNYFYCNDPNPLWEDLVHKGHAKKCGGHTPDAIVYYLIFESTRLVYGKRISEKAWREL
ncbi:hypothetical protein D3C73_1432550 [compost metagenome]